MAREFAPLKERIESSVVWVEGGCMKWVGTKNKQGYGLVFYQRAPGPKNRTSTTAHRKYYELVKGPIPDGLQVLHRCDNPACINPEHLFLGTQLDNIEDMKAKGRENFWGWNGGTRR